jgi:NAD+ diphosphatase
MRLDSTGAGDALAYSGRWLDRANVRRSDPQWVSSLLTVATTRVIPMWRDHCLVSGDPPAPIRLAAADAAAVLAVATEPAFLGLDGDNGVFAVDLSTLTESQATELTGADTTRDVRAIVTHLSGREAAVQAYARGMLHWHHGQRFCGTCGAHTESSNGGHARKCLQPECARLHFPQIAPAIIVLVEAAGPPPRCLLARHHGAGPHSYSTIAGFVEIGEDLENAVRREVAEETGVVLDTVTYRASQAWPFPTGLMVGFSARAAADDIAVDHHELEEARWFTRSELAERSAAGYPLGRVDSIDRLLLEAWFNQTK